MELVEHPAARDGAKNRTTPEQRVGLNNKV